MACWRGGGVVYKEVTSWGKPTGHKALPTTVGSRYYPLVQGTNGGSITKSKKKKKKKSVALGEDHLTGAMPHHRKTQTVLTCVPPGNESPIQMCSTPFYPSLQSSASASHWPNPVRNQTAREPTMGLVEQMEDAQLNGWVQDTCREINQGTFQKLLFIWNRQQISTCQENLKTCLKIGKCNFLLH